MTSCILPNHSTQFKLLELHSSIYFVDSFLHTIQTWKENRKKVQVPWCLPNALFILVHFSNVLGELPTHIYSIWSLFFLSNLFFGLEEWMTNQWLRQIERKRDTTFSFFMQNLCIFSNKNCQRPYKRSLLPSAASIVYVYGDRIE